MLLDYHIHPDYSIDAFGTMKEYADMAHIKGLDEICFTTHLDLVPERLHIDGFVRVGNKKISVKENWIPHYLDEIQKLKANFAPKGLAVLSGVEIDYHPEIEKEINHIVNNHPFDYVLGAVHSLEGYSIAIPEDCRSFCRGKEPQEVCRIYFELVIQAVESGFFDTIAHLDLYKRFSYGLYGKEINHAHQIIWDSVLTSFSSSQVGIEINTGNWRKGLNEPSPSSDLLGDLQKSGVRVVTVGSDAHLPGLVGKDINRAYAYLKASGFEGVHRFRNREAELAFRFRDQQQMLAE